jgi:hypothetical protein
MLLAVVAAWVWGTLYDVEFSRAERAGRQETSHKLQVGDGRITWVRDRFLHADDPLWYGWNPRRVLSDGEVKYKFEVERRVMAGEAWNYRWEPGLRGGRYFGVTWNLREKSAAGLDQPLEVTAPFSVLTLALGIPAAFVLRRWRRWLIARRRPAAGCCACGYDLRASPQRCPECGREVRAEDRLKPELRTEEGWAKAA